jgi:CRISPR/Cas system-associated protein endoribonuclease Cas2
MESVLLIVVCLQASVLVAICRTLRSLNKKVKKLEKTVERQGSRIRALMLIAKVLKIEDAD